MKISIDSAADVLYLTVATGAIKKTVAEGNFIADYDADGKLIGIEVLNYSKAANGLTFAGLPDYTPANAGNRQKAVRPQEGV